jgi:hypothetical protein
MYKEISTCGHSWEMVAISMAVAAAKHRRAVTRRAGKEIRVAGDGTVHDRCS